MDRDGVGEATDPAPGGGRGMAVVAAEVFGLLLMLLGVAGTCALLIAAHRRVASELPPAVVAAAPIVADDPEPEPVPPDPEPEPEPEPTPPPEAPAAPEVDPTVEALARIDEERAALVEAAERRARRLAGLGSDLDEQGDRIERTLVEAREAARRRALLAAEADRLEAEVQLVGLERDVLERRRDQAERHRQAAAERPGWAILPYRGPNGTWRRPIPVECRNGTATLEPGGLGFSMIELMSAPGRTGPFGAAVKRLARLLEAEGAPNGERVEPYVLFVVRPDGIRPFYEARGALDASGVPYGYELVDQDWEIEYPAWDDPTIWDALDASLRQDPSEADGLDGLGVAGRGGDALDGLAPFPGGRPGPDGMVGASRSLDDLLADGLPGGDGSAVAGFGSEGPGPGFPPGRPGYGPGDLPGGVPPGLAPDAIPGLPGEDTGPFGRSGVIPVLSEGSESSGDGPRSSWAAIDDTPSPGVGLAPEGGPWGDGDRLDPLGGLAGSAPIGASGRPGDGGGRAGIIDAPPGRLSLSPWQPGEPGNGLTSGRSGPIGPGAAGRPGGGGTGIGWQDGEPGPGPAGGLGRLLGGRSQAGGPGTSPGGDGSGGGSPGIGPTSGTPGGHALGDDQDGTVGSPTPGSGASGGGGGGGGAGGDLGSTIGRFELVVACGPKGVTIHPGGYKIGIETIRKDDDRLVQTLQAVLASRRRREPASARVPSLRFLVEPRGTETYWAARGQFELSGLGWPISWQASEPRTFTIFGSEGW